MARLLKSRAILVMTNSVSGLLLLVLFIQPLFQWRKIIDDRGRVHLVFARQCLQRFRPRFAQTHGQHPVQFFAGRFIAVDRTLIERAVESRFAA